MTALPIYSKTYSLHTLEKDFLSGGTLIPPLKPLVLELLEMSPSELGGAQSSNQRTAGERYQNCCG